MDRGWGHRRLAERQFMKGRGFGLVGDILVGVAGGLIGGWLASVLLKMPDAVNGINLASILVAFLGAVC